MLRDITLGQYYPADSVIHKLDPRVKLFCTMIYIISLFCFRGAAALGVATVFLAAELFSTVNLGLFAAAIALSFVLSGYFGLYSSQKIMFSKVKREVIDRYTG